MDYFIIRNMPTIILFVIIFIIAYSANKKKVPPNSVIIIDRNTHFYKKLSRGSYRLGPNDIVTSFVTTDVHTEFYKNIFETHNEAYYMLDFVVTYKSENIDMTLNALEDSKRSIYDIVNCAAETVIGSCISQEIMKDSMENGSQKIGAYPNLQKRLFAQLESTLEPFYIDVMGCRINNISSVPSTTGEVRKFRKHVSSSGGDNPFVS